MMPNPLLDAIREISEATLHGIGLVRDASRKASREAIRPELQALGIDHIDPFTPAGRARVSKARDERARAQQRELAAQRATQMDQLWDEHDRSIALPLNVRYPDWDNDPAPIELDAEGRPARRRHRPLESLPPTPAELLKVMPEKTPGGVGGGSP